MSDEANLYLYRTSEVEIFDKQRANNSRIICVDDVCERNRPESLTIEEKYRVTEVLGHRLVLELIYSVSRVPFALVIVITRGMMNLAWITKPSRRILLREGTFDLLLQ